MVSTARRRQFRQPGSTFKPVVYARAIQSRRFTPASLVVDAPAVYDEWKPRNYEQWNYQGAVRLREALARSINMVAIRVIEDLGVQEVAEFARQDGITTKLEPDMALALGASGVKPIELTNAYATFCGWRPMGRATDRDTRRGTGPQKPADSSARTRAGCDDPGRGLHHDQHASERGDVGNGNASASSRASGRRQDGDEQRGARCLVRRIFAIGGRRCLGRFSTTHVRLASARPARGAHSPFGST